jgi:hypothetical protein
MNTDYWLIDYLDSHHSGEDELPEIQTAIDDLLDYSQDRQAYYESKKKRLFEWDMDKFDAYAFLIRVFAICLQGEQTYQAMIGLCSPLVKCKDILSRIKCAAEAIAVISKSGLIDIEQVDDYYIVSTQYALDDPFPVPDKHVPVFAGVKRERKTMILGNKFKQHDGNLCPKHIATMDSIKLSLEKRIIETYIEDSPEEDAVTGSGWKESRAMYDRVFANGNVFTLQHNYDTRGRCYCEGYYINYQGSSYKKAIVQLHEKEIINVNNIT